MPLCGLHRNTNNVGTIERFIDLIYQRRQSGLKSWGSWIRVQQNFKFPDKFPINFDFVQAISQNIRFFKANIRKNPIFSGNFRQKFRFSRPKFPNDFFFRLSWQNWRFTATLGQIILFFLKSDHFRKYVLYMIRL